MSRRSGLIRLVILVDVLCVSLLVGSGSVLLLFVCRFRGLSRRLVMS